MKILIGTKNHGKIIEISEALSGLSIECLDPRSVGIKEDPEETGNTFAENALQKARFYFERTKGHALEGNQTQRPCESMPRQPETARGV
ncbi:MAG: dITP/XTP pyrophosphatase [Candidatus Peregrinibacteria bacterium Greene0416_62]|nr:MAG: dITP/XTP pyrophosphatase [Candidatus Peregrinibacteria bacterium Greene0416_62]